jgi:hypothetical protein
MLKLWDGQGTSYPPAKDKVYDPYVLSEAEEDGQGQGLAPAAPVP